MLLGISAYIVINANITGEEPYFFGYKPIVVISGSMEPYMKTNGIIIVKKLTDEDELNIDDVITFVAPDQDGLPVRVTHRLVYINDENGNMRTKGDNNNVVDGIFITRDNIEAKVVCVFNQTAWIVDLWSKTYGKIILISAGVLLIMVIIVITRIIEGRTDYNRASYKTGEFECFVENGIREINIKNDEESEIPVVINYNDSCIYDECEYEDIEEERENNIHLECEPIEDPTPEYIKNHGISNEIVNKYFSW